MANLKRIKGGFRINTTIDGKKVRRVFTTHRYPNPRMAALSFVANYKGYVKLPPLSISDAITEFLRNLELTHQIKPSSLGGVTANLRLFDRWTDDHSLRTIGDITIDHIRQYQIHVLSGRPRGNNAMSRHATWNRYRTALNRLFTFHVSHGKLRVNPIVGVKEFRLKEAETLERIFTEEEVEIILESFDGDDNPRVPAFFRLLLFTGIRAGEAVTMRWRQVNLKRRILSITGESKNYTVRTIPIHQTGLLPWLLAIHDIDHRPDSLVFPHGFATVAYSRQAWSKILRRRLASLGLPTSGLHAFRRTFATQLARQGVNVITLQKLAGWKTLAMAVRYCRLNDADSRTAIDGLEFSTDKDTLLNLDEKS